MEIYTTNVTVAQMGAACLGVGSPWTNLSVAGVNHALAPNAVRATVSADARLAAFRPDPAPMTNAPMTQSALMTAELLPTVNGTRKQNHVQKTRINAGGYGAMGPHPEREQPA